jgi:hypothetical protein
MSHAKITTFVMPTTSSLPHFLPGPLVTSGSQHNNTVDFNLFSGSYTSPPILIDHADRVGLTGILSGSTAGVSGTWSMQICNDPGPSENQLGQLGAPWATTLVNWFSPPDLTAVVGAQQSIAAIVLQYNPGWRWARASWVPTSNSTQTVGLVEFTWQGPKF